MTFMLIGENLFLIITSLIHSHTLHTCIRTHTLTHIHKRRFSQRRHEPLTQWLDGWLVDDEDLHSRKSRLSHVRLLVCCCTASTESFLVHRLNESLWENPSSVSIPYTVCPHMEPSSASSYGRVVVFVWLVFIVKWKAFVQTRTDDFPFSPYILD